MVFSAVALVAFSFAGMANNEVKEEKETETQEVLLKKSCASVYLDTYQAAVDNGANDQQAANVAWAAYSSCTGL